MFKDGDANSNSFIIIFSPFVKTTDKYWSRYDTYLESEETFRQYSNIQSSQILKMKKWTKRMIHIKPKSNSTYKMNYKETLMVIAHANRHQGYNEQYNFEMCGWTKKPGTYEERKEKEDWKLFWNLWTAFQLYRAERK